VSVSVLVFEFVLGWWGRGAWRGGRSGGER